MKKIFTAAFAIAVMAGCTKNEVVVSESPREITFQTISTKAVSGFSEDNHFFSFAYYLEKGKTWDADKNVAVEYLKNAEISYDTANQCWKNPTTSYYWPKAGTLTFFAWSDNTPSPIVDTETTVSCDKEGIKFSGYSIMKNVNKDLLVADIAKDQSSNTTSFEGNNGHTWKQGVLTQFRHIQSYLIFNVKTESDYAGVTFKVKSITLNGVEVKKDYSQATGWSSATKNGSFPVFTGDTQVTSTGVDLTPNVDDYKYVLPQNLDNTQKLEIEYTITTNYGVEAVQNVRIEKSLNDLYPNNWEAGKKYTLTITFGLEEILWAPDVVDWEVGTVNGTNI